METVVRRKSLDDIEAALDVYEAIAAEGRWIGAEAPIDREKIRPRRIEALSQGEVLFLVALVDGRLVGELSLEGGVGVSWLGMGILDGYRGAGIGRALMAEAIAWARTKDLDKIALHVWPHNERAISLYESFGFEQEGYLRKHFRRRNGEPWDAILMGLIL